MKAEKDYPALSLADLSGKLNARTITLIDANGSESYAEGHIPGAADFQAMESGTHAWPKDRNSLVGVYCGGPRCGAWRTAAEALTRMGFTQVVHYPGGLMEWTESGLRLEPGVSHVKSQDISAPESLAAISGCTLNRKEQADRIIALRKGLFKSIQSISESPGSLRLIFPDSPKNVSDLTDFIRFERKCCNALRFTMEWEPQGELVAIVLNGPGELLSVLKDAATD